jgi:hypothetical protein
MAMAWLSTHFPFPRIKELMSISTGIIGNEQTNCHMSHEVGLLAIAKIIGSNFESVKFKRKNRVVTLAIANSKIKVHDNVVPINPETLFQRMCIVKQSNEELQEYLQYELAPYPMSLFSEEGMRKGTKSSLYIVFSPVSYNIAGTSRIHIVDGGYLLHRVVILNFKLGHYTMEAVGRKKYCCKYPRCDNWYWFYWVM